MKCRIVKVDKTDKTETSLEGKEKPVRFIQLKYKCSPFLHQLREEDSQDDERNADDEDKIIFVDGDTNEETIMTMEEIAQVFARYFPKMNSRKDSSIHGKEEPEPDTFST